MRYSNAGEIIVMTIVWAVVLLVIDNMLSKPAEQAQPESQAQMEFPRPQVALVVRHVGCSDQYKEVERALQALPWLGDIQVQRGESHAQAAGTPQAAQPQPHTTATMKLEQPEEPCAVRVLAAVQSVEQADFMEITRTLRDIGMVPTTLLAFGGIPRFALRATVSDLSCDTCVQAAKDALTPLPVSASYYFSASNKQPSETDVLRVSKLTTFKWLDNKSVNPEDNTVTAHVLQNHTARVGEMIRALEGAGLLPLSIRIIVEKA